MIKPADYIQNQLDNLKQSKNIAFPKDQLMEEIIKKILSKKFRKFAVDDFFEDHIKKVVDNSFKKCEPIKMVLPFGGYKLWRIKTSPRVDWAELFSMMYFARYAKSIAEIYEPGVIFDFFSDDVIVSRMNNIPIEDIKAYQESFNHLLNFISSYPPANVKLVINRVRDQYEDQEFEFEIKTNIDKLKKELPGGLPKLDDIKKAMVELNVKLLPKQDQDPLWREKVLLIHDAYAMSSKRRPYYRNENKLMIVNVPLNGALALGTTKTSVAKFWCGTGILEKREDGYIERILSPKQIESTKLNMQAISIKGLSGINFKTIGIGE